MCLSWEVWQREWKVKEGDRKFNNAKEYSMENILEKEQLAPKVSEWNRVRELWLAGIEHSASRDMKGEHRSTREKKKEKGNGWS